MGEIKHLPEAIRSSVRSAIILFDLTRVVEELIFNSLDADATKISVALGVGTCYVKVADNGCGITRDGLVLLGERYATSKFGQPVGTGIITASFGFRGEALSSIANVSLVEVITKAHGRPNGYRKVMKGCKCLYIGIDDGRQDVGTTVIVRDLFYNQPVRRKHIQSSTTKVLQSVKKCVFRISLLYPKVSFKVVDVESDVELFCATPSSSPLASLMSGFGVEVTNLLRELNVTDGGLKLSGYMSSPCDTSSVKAFQYVYINSRYICKGTIHKLLNQLISGFNTSQHQKVNMGSQIAKRIRIQTCSNFILNLSCPRSWYDITFEPSKTSVDFKAFQDHKPTVVEEEDWNPIINFIKKAITHFWSEIFSSDIFQGDALSDGIGVPPDNVRREAGHASAPGEDFPARCRTARRKSRVQNHVVPISLPSPRLEMQNEEQDILAYHEDNKISCASIPYFKHQTELGHVYQSDSSVKSFDELLALSRVTVDREIGSYHNAAGYSFLSSEDHFAGNKFFETEKPQEHTDNVLNSSFEDAHIKMDASIRNGCLESSLPYDPFEIGSNVDNTTKEFKEPFLQRCTSRKIRLLDEESLMSSKGFDSPMDRLRCKRTHGMLTELNFSSQNSGKSSLSGASFSGGWGLDRENDLQVDSAVQMRQLSSTNWFSDSIMSSPLSDSVFGTKYHGFESSPVKNACREYETSTKYDYLADRDNMDRDFHFDDIISSTPSRENCSLLNGTNIHSDVRNHARICEDNFGFLPQHNPYDVTFPRSSDMFNDETNWLSSDLCGKYDGNCHATTSRLIPSSIYFDEGEGQKSMEECFWKQRPRRSHSAPPLYRGKKKFFALNNHLTTEAGKRKNHKSNNACTSQENSELKHLKRSSDVCQLDTDSNSMKDLLACTRKDKEGSDPSDLHFNCMSSVKDIQDPVVPELKWRGGYTKTANRDNSHNTQNEDTILDVSSGLLHLAGDSLVPDSIYKNFLKDAKVLQQVDKKFIPVVGNGFLSIIDQHAADERIRLEELRHKVLSGEKKTITYLDSEQKLVMPEIGYQLLHNYAEQIQKWGWLCNFHAQDFRSFKKNLNILHKQPTSITLIAVPCILGVNLTDVDLLEFLQQLADTDGSSTIPPSVHRILNSKACRGAIMFGDTLLPSECSLIVEELKRTSLCFQCAHGRPTTAPLVNLEALYKQIEKLGSWNGGSDVWHGLRRHAPSLERARHRLSSARQ